MLRCPTPRLKVGQDFPRSKHESLFFAVTCDAAALAEWYCPTAATETKKGNCDRTGRHMIVNHILQGKLGSAGGPSILNYDTVRTQIPSGQMLKLLICNSVSTASG